MCLSFYSCISQKFPIGDVTSEGCGGFRPSVIEVCHMGSKNGIFCLISFMNGPLQRIVENWPLFPTFYSRLLSYITMSPRSLLVLPEQGVWNDLKNHTVKIQLSIRIRTVVDNWIGRQIRVTEQFSFHISF